MLLEHRDAPRLATLTAEPLDTEGRAAWWLDGAEAVHASAPAARVVALDAILIAAAVSLTGASRSGVAAAAAAFVVAAWFGQLYRSRTTVEAVGLAWYARLLPLPLLAMGAALSVSGNTSGDLVLVAVLAAAAALLSVRTGGWLLVAFARRRRVGLRPGLVVGAPEHVERVSRLLDACPTAGVRVAADYCPTFLGGVDGTADEVRVRRLLQNGQVRHVLFSAEAHDDGLLGRFSEWCAGPEVDCSLVVPGGAATRSAMPRIGDVGLIPLARLSPARPRMWSKRAFDIAVSGLLLLLLAPVFALVSLAIWLYDRGPVFYRQHRVGLEDELFSIWKFRSMVPGADRLNDQYAHANVANGLLFKLPDDPRVTPVGHLIRRLSLDELPQLFNVLVGDMSLVGPRPLPVAPDDFDVVARRRHRVRPGITGPWQVAGGHVLGYDDMIKLDLAYVDTWSLRRDLLLLVMTIPTVLARRSLY